MTSDTISKTILTFSQQDILTELNKNNAPLSYGRWIQRPLLESEPVHLIHDSLTFRQEILFLPQYSNNIELRHTTRILFQHR
jgi:hypothetical protein